MSLTNVLCKNALPESKPYKKYDEKGLYLEVHPNGRKYWRMKYRFNGKEKRLAFGVYPDITLVNARDKRDDAKKMLREGVDPSQKKKDQKLQQVLAQENSFENVSREWIENKRNGWVERHVKSITRRLENNIFPALGSKNVNEITAPELLAVLRIIEDRGALDMSKRILQTCGQIFRYAIATGRAERDVAADLKGALKTPKKRHFAYLKENELPEFLSKLEEYDGEVQTRLAFKLLLLTFVRTTELRASRWEEVDFDKKQWRIPAERMKMKEEHIVPLSKQAIEVLKELKSINENRDYIFPNRNKPSAFMSENTLIYAFYRMGYHSKATVHGIRATASTIFNEHGFPPDVIERQLAHAPRNSVRASYNHAQYIKERTEMMQWWADFLDEQADKNM